jgi:hypothetical protein
MLLPIKLSCHLERDAVQFGRQHSGLHIKRRNDLKPNTIINFLTYYLTNFLWGAESVSKSRNFSPSMDPECSHCGHNSSP